MASSSSSSHTVVCPPVQANLHQGNNNNHLAPHTVDHPLVTVNLQQDNNDHLAPHTVNLQQDNNDHLAPHLAGPSFSVNSRMRYMASVRNSRANCQAHHKSIATLIRAEPVHQAFTMTI
jgi:hypothetical protein